VFFFRSDQNKNPQYQEYNPQNELKQKKNTNTDKTHAQSNTKTKATNMYIPLIPSFPVRKQKVLTSEDFRS